MERSLNTVTSFPAEVVAQQPDAEPVSRGLEWVRYRQDPRSKTLCALVCEKPLYGLFSMIFVRASRDVEPQGNRFRILSVIVRNYRESDFNPCAMAQIVRYGTNDSQDPALPRIPTRFQNPAVSKSRREQDVVQDLVAQTPLCPGKWLIVVVAMAF
jgi:hypothetical protein